MDWRAEVLGESLGVLERLPLDPGQGVCLWLCLQHADRLGVHVHDVVGGAVPCGEFPDGHAAPRVDVEVRVALYEPPRLLQLGVDALAGFLLRACRPRAHLSLPPCTRL